MADCCDLGVESSSDLGSSGMKLVSQRKNLISPGVLIHRAGRGLPTKRRRLNIESSIQAPNVKIRMRKGSRGQQKNPPMKMSGLKFINITVQKLEINIPEKGNHTLLCFRDRQLLQPVRILERVLLIGNPINYSPYYYRS